MNLRQLNNNEQENFVKQNIAVFALAGLEPIGAFTANFKPLFINFLSKKFIFTKILKSLEVLYDVKWEHHKGHGQIPGTDGKVGIFH